MTGQGMALLIRVSIVASIGAGCLFAQAQARTDPAVQWQKLMDEGIAARGAGQYQEAAKALGEAVRIAEEPGFDQLHLASALNSYALVQIDLGELVAAEQGFRRAMSIIVEVSGPKSLLAADIQMNRSDLLLRKGQDKEAEQLLREVISIYSREISGVGMRTAVAKSCLADALLRRGDFQNAEQLIQDALAVFANEPVGRQDYYGMALSNLGAVRRYQGRDEEAVALFLRALATLEASRGNSHPSLIYPLNNLGFMYYRMNRGAEAEAAFQRALKIAEACYGTANPMYGNVLLNYAQYLKKAGNKQEAKSLAAKASSLLKDNARKNGLGMTVDVSAFRAR